MSRIVALGEVAEINPRLRTRPQLDDLVSFLGMADVDAEYGTTSRGVAKKFGEVAKGYTQFENGDILVAKITPCFENGKIAQAGLDENNGAGSTEFHVVRADLARLDRRYLLHFLRQPYIRVAGERRMTGSGGQRRVPEAYISHLKLPLPEISEQRRIAEVLDRVDELRAKRRQSIALLDDLARSIFLDMFGTPSTSPHGWPIIELGDLIVDGPQNGMYKPASDYGSGTPIVRIDSFYDGVITKLPSLKRVDTSIDERLKYGLSAGNILINRVNSIEYLGKSALVPDLTEETVFESNMMRIAVDLDRMTPRYLVKALCASDVRRQILSRAKRSVNQASINQADVRGLRLVCPPLSVQVEFAERVAHIDRQQRLKLQALDQLDSLFSSLQSRAFQGTLWKDDPKDQEGE
ncbi:restriction endonuclease subunit S [Nocardia sp. NPDC056064]|uniref:restriction endonuclease subunit S n=1 Tax=Nocardia sp. NPDC056064 TaxID=3345701 RepID=UPI0035D746FD